MRIAQRPAYGFLRYACYHCRETVTKRQNVVFARPSSKRLVNGTEHLERYTESVGGFAVRMGLRHVKGLGKQYWRALRVSGTLASFASVYDFVRRIP